MRILVDTNTHAEPELLDAAWAATETFAYVPQKSGVTSAWLETALHALPSDLQRDHFALLTSGSTGQPKLVIGEKRRADALARTLHQAQESEEIERTIVVLPLTYCYAFVNQWRWARTMERELVMSVGFSDPARLARQLLEAPNSMLCMVGAQVPLLLQSLPDAHFPGVRRLHFAGGRFPQDKLDQLHAFFPNATIFNNYGCAEAMPRLTLRKADESPIGANIGRPLPGIELHAGEDSKLLFRSPFGSVAYVDADGFHPIGVDEWIPTGDLARGHTDGTWELLGRANEVFKRYGEKISIPTVMAAVASEWRGNVEAYRESDSTGEMGYVLVLAPEPTDNDVRGILRALRSTFTRVHWPLRIESMSALPRLPNGKIDRMGLGDGAGRQIQWRQRL